MAQGDFTNILPDPNNAYNNAGQATGTQKGPGYSQVKLTSQHELMKSRTNSGRLIAIDNSHHKWNIDISYNPMTRDEFEPINSFLNQRRSFLKPFKVSLSWSVKSACLKVSFIFPIYQVLEPLVCFSVS